MTSHTQYQVQDMVNDAIPLLIE